jgi:hypothetical protein
MVNGYHNMTCPFDQAIAALLAIPWVQPIVNKLKQRKTDLPYAASAKIKEFTS